MKILYIGEPQTYKEYVKGKVPSHWLYGACEMEKDGHQVIWEKERRAYFNDFNLIIKHKPDIIFIPNLNIKNHLFLLIINALKLLNVPIYAYLHHGKKYNKKIYIYFFRFLLKRIRHIFFLSEKSMSETINSNIINKNKCSVPGWGPDMSFYDRIPKKDCGYFISTGKENRDFEILIQAFEGTEWPLKIITSRSHAGKNYEFLTERCKNIKNIEVQLTDNTCFCYSKILEEMANSKALVCPLLTNSLDYCVGLSTITDAEGLKKALIITKNQYHDKNRIKEFEVVESVSEWKEAIKKIFEDKGTIQINNPHANIVNAYAKMKKIMSL